ncbi:ATP-dependent RNA helicase [Candidatus Woesearchaeota archaeon CG10_big_fil_rev_8_21_14_0_10_34_8]|nr:MAG: ATP-dependent RNA helicase [Candidatus Woesearchaeota archaeon CG10_big_fil_rev_8_21_14_0_10_34_8]
MNKFKELGIEEPILRVIEEKGFNEPSDIQAKTIPLILKNKDVIAGAATGSGKTLAFSVGIIQHSQPGRGIQALVLTPTRELADQVAKVISKFSKHLPKLKIAEIYGGVSINPQMSALKIADVVVGTPGRLLDHLERGTINLSNVKILVLDEADRMLDMGFIEDVERIISQCAKKRQTLFYSATISQEVKRLAKKYMHDPQHISVEQYVDPSQLKQVYYNVKDNLKFSLLVSLLKHEHPGLVMVFCNSRRNTDFVAKNLKFNGIDAIGIHGGLTQASRTRVMERFHSGKVVVLVCTDVAARGLDIPDVSHVYNYDAPNDSKQYVHRIGRTARAGKDGMAVNILSSRDHDNFDRVLSENPDLNIVLKETPFLSRVNITPTENRRSHGHKRPSHGRPSSFGRRPKHRFSKSHRISGR